MPILSDFTVIRNNNAVVIGDTGANPIWETNFRTGGRHSSAALLSLSARGLTRPGPDARVLVNNREVGTIPSYDNGVDWHTITFAFDGGILSREGDNELQINASVAAGDEVPGFGAFDDFQVRNVVCFFHQES